MSKQKQYLLGMKNFFSIGGLEKFFGLLTKKEKIIFFVCTFFFFLSGSFLLTKFYFEHTKVVPKKGGQIILGEVGRPAFLNPIYSLSNDVDEAITQILFSGLMKYEGGELVPDLAKEYKILEGGKVFEVSLKDEIFWSDGQPITSDDVVFTLEIIQNPEVKSPLRSLWTGVDIEKISNKTFRFLLKEPSAVFLESLTLKIIPKHIWEKIPLSNFHLASFNLEPVSSGPYKVEKVEKDEEGKVVALFLTENEKYFGKKPFISKIKFLFFDTENELKAAAKAKKIDGFSLTKFEKIPGFKVLRFKMPRYFGVFFNLENKIFAIKKVREALNLATPKKEILNEVYFGYGQVVNSPILPKFFGLKGPKNVVNFDLEKANLTLKEAGFEDFNGDGKKEKIEKKEPSFQFKSDLKIGSSGSEVEELQKCLAKDKEVYPEGEVSGYFGPKTKAAVIRFQEKYKKEILEPFGLEKGNGIVGEKTREKLNQICFERKEEKIDLKFDLITVDQEILVQIAEKLKNQWEKIGVGVEIKKEKIENLQREALAKKNYEAILFGEALNKSLDLFAFWHSSQKGEMGLNLANYENKKVDEILEKVRKTLDWEERKKMLEEFQEIWMEDLPAVLLFNPDYLYFVSEKIKGTEEEIIFNSAGKFSKIENWHLKTKRIWELK